ncbi:MAG: S41 family peptidase [Planctomycetota bacterium]|nr:S41 family peptidase [Planctomycetota bacterium]
MSKSRVSSLGISTAGVSGLHTDSTGLRRLARVARFGLAALALSAGLALSPAAALARPDTNAAAAITDPTPVSVQNWSSRLWTSARLGDVDQFKMLLENPPAEVQNDAAYASLRESIALLKTNVTKREEQRDKRLGEVRDELKELLDEDRTPAVLSNALKFSVELHELSRDKATVLADPQVSEIVTKAKDAALEAEAKGDWLMSTELFVRLNALLEQKGTFKDDVDRQGRRLAMLRLYAPKRLWELRDARLRADGEKPLPEYNGAADDYHNKLKGIDKAMVLRALNRAATEHVEQTTMRQVLTGAVDTLRTMAGTVDLRAAFAGLGNDAARAKFIAALDAEAAALKNGSKPLDLSDAAALLDRVLAANNDSVKIFEPAVLHEFGNGGMGQLDEFSAIIWPDELARFDRMTQGEFVGVGVQIEFDEFSNIKVVSPLEGTPAFRAGLRPGDVIKKVDGVNTFGLTLDQAVDLITGPINTKVTLTVEREDDAAQADAEGKKPKREIDFAMNRGRIEVVSVKGWKREGVHEDDWNWFVDEQNKIGYIRLTQFSRNTAAEFKNAVDRLEKRGMKGLVVDLRFNPGGYLDQAVEIANEFINQGVIVMMQGPSKRPEQPERAQVGRATLGETPVVVLVNEGSASASEIVSGALQYYGSPNKTGSTIKTIVMGSRSFGKGSVQKVYSIGDNARMKLTTQYYMLPNGRIVHRKPGAADWGVTPNLLVEMLPKQVADALTIRKNADVLALDGAGNIVPNSSASANPDDLLSKGTDLQLETALLLIKSQVPPKGIEQARANEEPKETAR